MENTGRGKLRFCDAYVNEKYMYFSARNFNGFFRLELGKAEADFIGYFKDEEMLQKNLHRQVVCVDDKLFFIPYTGKGVSIFDIKKGTFSFVKIKEGIIVSRAFVMDEDIIMIPSTLDSHFVLFHTKNNTYEIMESLESQISVLRENQELHFLGLYGSCMSGYKIYLSGIKGKILCVDLKNDKIKCYDLPKEYCIRNLYFDKNETGFLLLDNSQVVQWNIRNNKWQEYGIMDADGKNYPRYMTILGWNTHILLLPDHAKGIWELDQDKNEWFEKKHYLSKEFRRDTVEGSLFAGYRFLDGKLVLFPWSGNGILVLTETGSEFYEVLCPDKVVNKIRKIQDDTIKEQVANHDIIYERSRSEICHNTLLFMIHHCMNGRNSEEIGNAGEQIWKLCKAL